jgi:hypothetical protein
MKSRNSSDIASEPGREVGEELDVAVTAASFKDTFTHPVVGRQDQTWVVEPAALKASLGGQTALERPVRSG